MPLQGMALLSPWLARNSQDLTGRRNLLYILIQGDASVIGSVTWKKADA